MSRLIINNKSDLPDVEAVNMVLDVLELGRISNNGEQYCYLTVFSFDEMVTGIKVGEKEYKISSGLTETGTDTFTILGPSIKNEN
jgi:hypothetical protein